MTLPPATSGPARRTAAAKALPKATIVKRVDHTPDLWLIWLKPDVPFTFRPGQYCTIGRDGIERAYSIVSAPYEPLLELFIELVPDGELTPRLHKLQVGDAVTIRPSAKGVFTFEPRYKNHLMVSTVTGVVPYISIIRQALRDGLDERHHYFLLHGASYQDELVYTDEMLAWAKEAPAQVTVVPTVSRPQEERNSGWNGETGRVNAIVEKYIEKFGLNPASTLVYACGHPGMIEDVKARLGPKRFPVKEERFWKQ
ncbi:MAG: ferredoxin--NADP reductase [Chloroflexi bacterium]|nr:ferredoxin--NADP reductase [Chloroflexota bacterium]